MDTAVYWVLSGLFAGLVAGAAGAYFGDRYLHRKDDKLICKGCGAVVAHWRTSDLEGTLPDFPG